MNHHPSTLPAARGRFAHRSEQLFAALLDVCGVAWEYEPVEFTLTWGPRGERQRGFRPDFFLPAWRCFVELTTADQRWVTKKNAKVRAFRQLYPEVELFVLYQRGLQALLAEHGLAGALDDAA